MSITDNFYNKIINNLQTIKKSFYLYNNKKISYSELFQKIKKINFYLKDLKKKELVYIVINLNFIILQL